MTNEEIVEELYHEAYSLGFINELRKKVDYLTSLEENKKLSRYEIVYKAYNMLKIEGTI